MTQTLIKGDCIKALDAHLIPKIDVVVTSPPYNIGLGYDTYSDTKSNSDYISWLSTIFAKIGSILNDDGHIFLNIDGTSKHPYLPFELVIALKETFVLQNTITWVKSIAIDDVTTGHFKPINSKRYLNHTHEYIFHFTKAGAAPIDRKAIGVPYMDKTNIARRNHDSDKRCRGDVWFVPYETIQSKDQKFHHPGTFPVKIPQMCLSLNGKDKGVVFDPFVGTGTTLIAAAIKGWDGYGCDISKSYLDAAALRLKLCKFNTVDTKYVELPSE